MPTLMETTLKFDCTRLEEQVLLNKEKDVQLDTRVTALENAPAYTPTDLDLNTGIVSVNYNTTNGISLTTQGTIKSNKGTNPVVVDYEIPIVGANGILIDKQANADKIEVKIDPTENLKCKSLTAEDVSGSVTQSTKLNYDGYITITNPAGTRMFSIPWNYGAGSLLTDKSVKTLFGKSIYGTGNIGLYRHVIKITGRDVPYSECFAYLTIISSKKENVEFFSDLITLLGDTFEYPATGYDIYNLAYVYKVTQDGIVSTNNQGSSVTLSFANMTVFTDTVTTV